MANVEDRTSFWTKYYSDVHGRENGWLDYSNERVQAQSLAVAIEAAGPLEGRSCIDAGAGKGQLAHALRALGAQAVTAIELVSSTVEALGDRHPDVTWRQGSVADPKTFEGIGAVDVLFAVEVLQYVPLRECLSLLWSRVRPGGRLVGVIPNAGCPLVARAVARFGGEFVPAHSSELSDALSSLPEVGLWRCRGLTFAADQAIAPYEVSAWKSGAGWTDPPNRFAFVAVRAGPGPS